MMSFDYYKDLLIVRKYASMKTVLQMTKLINP
jgi:hypothetical protein